MVELLTVQELAIKLKVSPWTVYGWVSQNFIPHHKLRSAVRFNSEEVDAWLKKNHVKGKSIQRLRIEAAMGEETENSL